MPLNYSSICLKAGYYMLPPFILTNLKMRTYISLSWILLFLPLGISQAQSKLLNSLQVAYQSCLVNQDYACALDFMQKSLGKVVSEYGTDHQYVPYLLDRFELLYQQHSDYRQAKALLEKKAYQKVEKICLKNQFSSVANNPFSLLLLGTLAITYSRQGKLVQAEDCFIKLFPHALDTSGTFYNAERVWMLNEYAACNIQLQKYHKAELIQEKTLVFARKMFPETHQSLLKTINLCIKHHLYTIQIDKALSLLQQKERVKTASDLTFVVGEFILQDARFRQLWTLFNQQVKLTKTALKLPFLPQMATMQRRLLELEKQLGKTHILYIAHLLNLADIWQQKHQYLRSLRLLEQVMSLTKDFDSNAYALCRLLSLSKKAVCLNALGRKEASVALIKKLKNVKAFAKQATYNSGLLVVVQNIIDACKDLNQPSIELILLRKFFELRAQVIKRPAINPNELFITYQKLRFSSNKTLKPLGAHHLQKNVTKSTLCKRVSCADMLLHKSWGQRILYKKIVSKLSNEEVAIHIKRVFCHANKLNQCKPYYVAIVVSPNLRKPQWVLIGDEKLEGSYYQDYWSKLQSHTNDLESYQRYWGAIDQLLGKLAVKKLLLFPEGIYRKINIAALKNLKNQCVFDSFDIRLYSTPDAFLASPKAIVTNSSILPTYYLINSAGDSSHNSLLLHYLWSKKLKVSHHSLKQLTQLSPKNPSPMILHFGNQISYGKVYVVTKQPVVASEDIRQGLCEVTTQQTNKVSHTFWDSKDSSNIPIDSLYLTNTELVIYNGHLPTEPQYLWQIGYLQQNLIKAGAKNVLLLLWPIDHQFQERFLIKLYEAFYRLKNIRQAFHSVRSYFAHHKRYNHPYYWASFVLTSQ